MTTVTEKLIQLAQDGYYPQAFAALAAVGGDPALNYLLEQSYVPARVDAVMPALGRIGGQAAVTRLQEFATSDVDATRAGAYQALAVTGESFVVDFLFEAIASETSPIFKSIAVSALVTALQNQ
jgi:HEAT repeat protein